jgi:hypothetical protein
MIGWTKGNDTDERSEGGRGIKRINSKKWLMRL